MRSVDGIVALREIAKIYGPVRIDYVPENKPDPWTVSLADLFSHEHGSSLQDAAVALMDQLERGGPMTLADAERLGGRSALAAQVDPPEVATGGPMTQMAREIRLVTQRFAPNIMRLPDNVLEDFEQIISAFALDLKREREGRERRNAEQSPQA